MWLIGKLDTQLDPRTVGTNNANRLATSSGVEQLRQMLVRFSKAVVRHTDNMPRPRASVSKKKAAPYSARPKSCVGNQLSKLGSEPSRGRRR